MVEIQDGKIIYICIYLYSLPYLACQKKQFSTRITQLNIKCLNLFNRQNNYKSMKIKTILCKTY